MKLPGVRSILLLGCLAILLLAAGALARGGANQGTPAAAARGTEAEWLVESPHTPAQMVQAAGEMKDLPLWHFGCEAGEHKAWIIVRAADEQAALGIVPASLRGQARAHKLNTFTPSELKSFHQR